MSRLPQRSPALSSTDPRADFIEQRHAPWLSGLEPLLLDLGYWLEERITKGEREVVCELSAELSGGLGRVVVRGVSHCRELAVDHAGSSLIRAACLRGGEARQMLAAAIALPTRLPLSA